LTPTASLPGEFSHILFLFRFFVGFVKKILVLVHTVYFVRGALGKIKQISALEAQKSKHLFVAVFSRLEPIWVEHRPYLLRIKFEYQPYY
jgi:hypothetical protein